MVILPTINPKVVADEICEYIRQIVLIERKSGAIVGLSGGVDSAVVAFLAMRAFKNMKYEIKAYIIPSYTNESDEGIRASHLCDNYKIDKTIVHIEELVDTTEKCFNKQLNPFDKGNMTSRVRANILSTYAAVENKVLLGTGNKDEDFGIGYYTLFGDGAVHCSPIGGLSKRLVYQMAKYLSVPHEIIAATPTAGLEHGQTDYGDLGYGYDVVEFYIEARRQKIHPKYIVEEAKLKNLKYNGCIFASIEHVFNDIYRRHINSLGKLEIIHPPSPEITLNYGGES
jgi:NAD+ synthase